MKGTDNFKTTILKALEKRAEEDELFAVTFKKEKKNIDDCIKYILNTVQKSKIQGFTDEEVYAMAVHYYDEDEIDAGKDVKCQVVVNHTVQLTEEEKKEARQKAIDDLAREQKNKMRGTGKKKEEAKVTPTIDFTPKEKENEDYPDTSLEKELKKPKPKEEPKPVAVQGSLF